MSKRAYGFTIVELLVVIVVIAVLAAVSIVAYNGIQLRAKKTATSAAVAQASRQIALHIAEKGNPPSSLTEAGITTPSGGVDFMYSASGSGWCVAGTNNGVSYFASNTSTAPAEGDCVYQSATATFTSPGIASGAKTIVFAGSTPTDGSPHYVFDLRPAGNNWLYGNTSWVAYGYPNQWVTYRVESGKVLAYVVNPPGAVYIGQRYSLNEYWQGSWKALTFSEVLTNAQIEQVIAKLKTEI